MFLENLVFSLEGMLRTLCGPLQNMRKSSPRATQNMTINLERFLTTFESLLSAKSDDFEVKMVTNMREKSCYFLSRSLETILEPKRATRELTPGRADPHPEPQFNLFNSKRLDPRGVGGL